MLSGLKRSGVKVDTALSSKLSETPSRVPSALRPVFLSGSACIGLQTFGFILSTFVNSVFRIPTASNIVLFKETLGLLCETTVESHIGSDCH